MKYTFLFLVLFITGCSSTPAFIKSAYDSVDTINTATENLLRSDVIEVEDAEQVATTVEHEILPRIEAAEKAWAEWRIQAEVHGIDNGGDKTAQQYIAFASDYINGLFCQLKLSQCKE